MSPWWLSQCIHEVRTLTCRGQPARHSSDRRLPATVVGHKSRGTGMVEPPFASRSRFIFRDHVPPTVGNAPRRNTLHRNTPVSSGNHAEQARSQPLVRLTRPSSPLIVIRRDAVQSPTRSISCSRNPSSMGTGSVSCPGLSPLPGSHFARLRNGRSPSSGSAALLQSNRRAAFLQRGRHSSRSSVLLGVWSLVHCRWGAVFGLLRSCWLWSRS